VGREFKVFAKWEGTVNSFSSNNGDKEELQKIPEKNKEILIFKDPREKTG